VQLTHSFLKKKKTNSTVGFSGNSRGGEKGGRELKKKARRGNHNGGTGQVGYRTLVRLRDPTVFRLERNLPEAQHVMYRLGKRYIQTEKEGKKKLEEEKDTT